MNSAKKSPLSVISSTLAGSKGQTCTLVEVVKLPSGKCFRIEIRIDSYKGQQSATISLWNGGVWAMVHSIAGEAMKAEHNGYAARGFSRADFEADAAELVRVAIEVVS